MFPSPTRMFLTKGVGIHRHALTAFELALRDADVEQQNLVNVSSILTAEASGLDSIWIYDHLLYHFPEKEPQGVWEGWTIASALAEATQRAVAV